MDKIKINNQIVQMRKYVKQAKVHVINRLVKEVKLLQNRKGNENNVSKAKRKAERLLAEIAIIKTIKPDSISKLAISKALDWNSILQQKNASLEDRCISMLANYKPVQEEVENFHTSNKELISKIPECLKEWEEKPKKPNEGLPKQSVKASDLRQKKKEKKMKLNKSSHKLCNVRELLLVSDEQISQKSDSASPKIYSLSSTSFKEHERSNTVDDGGNSSLNDENEKKKLLSEQCKNVSENISYLKSTCDLQKLDIPLTKNEICSASFCSNADDKVENDITTFQHSNDSFSDKFVDNSSINHATVKNSPIPGNKSELHLKNTEEKTVVLMTDNNLEYNESKLNSDTDDVECTKHSLTKKKCMISTEKTKQTASNKSHNLKAIKRLNLEDLKHCEEIPIVDTSDSEHSNVESKSDEQSDTQNAESEESDPFFLREGETASVVKTAIKEPFKNDLCDASPFVRKSGLKKNSFSSHASNEKSLPKQEFNKRIKVFSDSKMPKSFKFQHDNLKNDSRWTAKRKFPHTVQQDISLKRKIYQDKNVQNDSKIFRKDSKTSSQDMKYTNSKEKHKSITKKEKLSESLPIHPSWEAKRKLKENKNVQFQGKRMVFND